MQSVAGGDLVRLDTAVPYTGSYNDVVDQGQREVNAGFEPELKPLSVNVADYDVIATMNLNGDYVSDALAAQVGGIGIAPGANLSDTVAIFEATHGTGPAIAGKNIATPCSEILSAQMMLRHMGWNEAADLIEKGVAAMIASGRVTADLAALVEGAVTLTCSGFGDELIAKL